MQCVKIRRGRVRRMPDRTLGQKFVARSRVGVRGAARGMGKLPGTDKTAAQDRAGTKSVGKHDPPAAAPRLRQAAWSGAMRTEGSTKEFTISVAGPRAATVARIHCVLLGMPPGHHVRVTKKDGQPLRLPGPKSKPRQGILLARPGKVPEMHDGCVALGGDLT